MKKFLATVIAVMMMLTVMGVPAFAAGNVAEIDGVGYATVQEAIDACDVGDNEIQLLPGVIDEDVFILQKEGINITIKGQEGVTYTGEFTVCGNARDFNKAKPKETLTFDGISFEAVNITESQDFISSNRKETINGVLIYSYPHNVTVKNCTFIGNFTNGDVYNEQYDVVALRNVGGFNWTVENCTARDMHSFMWASYHESRQTIDNLTVEHCGSGLSLGTNANYTITNSTFDVIEHAIRSDANSDRNVNLVIENCEMRGDVPFILRNKKENSLTYDVSISESNIVSTTGGAAFVRTGETTGSAITVTANGNYWGGSAPQADGIEIAADSYYTDEEKTQLVLAEGVDGNVYVSGKGLYDTFDEALAASEDGDTINLLGKVHKLTNTQKTISKKSITIVNGTFDITDGVWSGDGIFRVGHYDVPNVAGLYLKNVTFTGDNYSSAFGVIYVNEGNTVSIEGCTFNLSNERYSAGAVLKGNGINVSNFIVKDSTFTLENPNRVIANATVELDGVTINAKVTDDTLVVGLMNNHAFRNLVGTVKNSNIFASGFETGINNTTGDLVISDNTTIKLVNSKDTDLIVGAGRKIDIDATSVLYADTTSIADDDAVTGEGFIDKASEIDVEFVRAEEDNDDILDNSLWNIVLVGDEEETINRLNSADLTFILTTNDDMAYEIIASNPQIKINPVNNSTDRYEFHFDGKDAKDDTAKQIIIGQVKITGYGNYTFAVDENANATNVVHATALTNNIVDTFVPKASTNDDNGELDLDDAIIANKDIIVPTKELKIDICFPNSVEKKAAAYQQMKVTVSGGDLDKDIKIELGDVYGDTDLTYAEKAGAKYNVALGTDDCYIVTLSNVLTVDTTYTVTVEGAGYRTARYSVTMTDDKELNFWNNVMDEEQPIEIGKDSSNTDKNFLAGDIVKDANINIYDLSAVVSYFGTTGLSASNMPTYAKYDLNRDGVIDSKDVAYVLVSWDK